MRSRSLAVFLLVLAFSLAADAQTTEFVYQGQLQSSSMPANGSFDFEFLLFDQFTAGSQVGSTLARNGVLVANGSFSTKLDFGAVFPGADRFIEIRVQPTGGDRFTILTPRQPVSSSPYAIRTLSSGAADSLSAACTLCITDAHITSIAGSKVTGTVASAANAGSANTANNALNLGGVPASGYLSTGGGTVTGNLTVNGILSGNGSGLTSIPGTFKWQVVAGTSQQALPNNGYLASNANQVTITLPTAPNVGDTIRIAGVGAGGWLLAQNAGQRILTPTDADNTTGRRYWYSVASSSDGTKLVGVVDGGPIFTSTDAGVSWTRRESNRAWYSVASSADGTKLVAAVNGGRIYTSTDSGVTWTPRDSARQWFPVASSADGTKLVAGVRLGGMIYTSTDSGVTWFPRDSGRNWASMASSADGTKLVAGVSGGQVYTSTDSGLTWFPRDVLRDWRSLASSADGTKLVAAVNNARIYTSTDSGLTWVPRESSRQWYAVASSADGTKLVAAVNNGSIYTSTDSGLTWLQRDSSRNWYSIASSADGTKLVAVVNNGLIYTSTDSGVTWTPPPPSGTSTGTGGNMIGPQYAHVELIYTGGGEFLVLSFWWSSMEIN